MKICIFGSEEDRSEISELLSQTATIAFGEMKIDLYSDYDEFVYKGSKIEYDAVFVTADNAAGMEGVIAAKKIFPAKPVIWLSNDNDFGTQSYRLDVAYFHTKPITANILKKAMKNVLCNNYGGKIDDN